MDSQTIYIVSTAGLENNTCQSNVGLTQWTLYDMNFNNIVESHMVWKAIYLRAMRALKCFKYINSPHIASLLP